MFAIIVVLLVSKSHPDKKSSDDNEIELANDERSYDRGKA